MKRFVSILALLLTQFTIIPPTNCFTQEILPVTVWNDPALLRHYNPRNANVPPPVGIGIWATCADPNYYNFPVATDNTGQLRKECQPDTLYSWGDAIKVQVFKQFSFGLCDPDKCFSRPIYSHINPLATFGFGEMQIRIKLKPGTKFEIIKVLKEGDHGARCQDWPPDKRANTVSVRIWRAENTDGFGVDYVFCSPGPIHSWSFGTNEGYDEIVNAQLWLNNHPTNQNWLPWSRSLKTGLPDLYTTHEPFTRTHIKNNLILLQKVISAAEGGIFYPPNRSADPAFHFSTTHPTYWNWQ